MRYEEEQAGAELYQAQQKLWLTIGVDLHLPIDWGHLPVSLKFRSSSDVIEIEVVFHVP